MPVILILYMHSDTKICMKTQSFPRFMMIQHGSSILNISQHQKWNISDSMKIFYKVQPAPPLLIPPPTKKSTGTL